MSPDAVLAHLIEGNAGFVARKLESLNDQLAVFKQNTVARQEPYAVILSRMPAEPLFDQST